MPSLVPAPIRFTPRDPLPEDLAALGREVLELVPREKRGALEAYRMAATALSQILHVGGMRVKPKALYYAALRVKWITENTPD
jgi:hypothetical protein